MRSKIKSFSCQQGEMFNQYVENLDGSFLDKESIAEKVEFNTFVTFLDPKKTDSVLDIGSGYGRYSLKIAKYVRKIAGIDVSKKSIKISNSIALKRKILNFKGIISDFSSPTKILYDKIFLINTLHHIDDIHPFLTNVRKSLKKDGSLVIFEFNPLNILFVPFLISIGQIESHLNKGYFRSNIFSLRKILNANNFSINELQRYALFPTSLYNESLWFKYINDTLCNLPIINTFTAFHFIKCSIKDSK